MNNENKIEKILKLDVHVGEDIYEGIYRESIHDNDNDIYFSVNNLSECPEDAIIGRDLFDSNDYIRALNKGIELANKGYTRVEFGKEIKEEE